MRQLLRQSWKNLTRPRPKAAEVPLATTARPVEKPLKRLARSIRRLPRKVLLWLRHTFILVGRGVRGSWAWFRGWLRFGEGYSFLRGVPAVIACAAVIWALLAPYFQRVPRSARYAVRLATAVRNGDLQEAELCAERLVHDTKGTPFYVYAYAKLLWEQGERARALALMNRIAPPDASGYGPAQLWQAHRLLVQKDLSPESIKELERRLLWASKEEGSSGAAQALLVGFYSRTGKLQSAEEHLQNATSTDGGAQLNLALNFALTGDQERSHKYALIAQEMLGAASKNQPENARLRLEWAQSAALLGDFQTAIRVLEEGFERTHGPGYLATLSRLYFAWSNSLLNIRARIADRLLLLARSIEYDDANPLMLRMLLDTAPMIRPDANEVRAQVDQMIAKNNSPAVLQIFLGVDSLEKKDVKEANRRFDLARAANADAPRLLNNMAWTLAKTKPERLELAMDLINAAITRVPTQTRFLGTRGQILDKLERWQDARADLQRALQVMPDNQDLKDTMDRVTKNLQKTAHDPKREPSAKVTQLPDDSDFKK